MKSFKFAENSYFEIRQEVDLEIMMSQWQFAG